MSLQCIEPRLREARRPLIGERRGWVCPGRPPPGSLRRRQRIEKGEIQRRDDGGLVTHVLIKSISKAATQPGGNDLSGEMQSREGSPPGGRIGIGSNSQTQASAQVSNHLARHFARARHHAAKSGGMTSGK